MEINKTQVNLEVLERLNDTGCDKGCQRNRDFPWPLRTVGTTEKGKRKRVTPEKGEGLIPLENEENWSVVNRTPALD